jgi:hypothetical protein
MTPFRLRLGHLQLDYDRNYGIKRRTGWSVSVRGSYVVQFVGLFAALWALWNGRRA